MTIVANQLDAIIGVDTHTDTHTAALLSPIGAVLAHITVPADAAGYTHLQSWAAAHAPGPRLVWALEGTRSHGTGLTRALSASGATVVEAPSPTSARKRRSGKSDQLDAIAAARNVLALDKPPAQPRADGTREDLRILLARRHHDTRQRTATINLFKSLILTADEPTRAQLRGLSTARQVRQAAAWPTSPHQPLRHRQLTELAHRIRELTAALTANNHELATLVKAFMPSLLDLRGVGPVAAATLITTWSHRGRIHSEAAFAALAGVSPIPASSGRNQRMRLNRGGDRHLNAALHTIMLTRRRCDPETRAYITRRTNEGKPDREITRCLKRYLARNLHRHMQAHAPA